MAGITLYSPSLGIQYASKYYGSGNPQFYHAGVDCTNFVSQCIWAAYGGWSPTMSEAEVAKNIKNGFRMVKGAYSTAWYANSGGGSKAWENVDALWSFMMQTRYKGPIAAGFNSGKKYSNMSAKEIKLGDVLQFSLDGKDYHHTAYVILIENLKSPTFDTIYVAQHTANMIRTVSDAIQRNGGDNCYMRRMTFRENIFES